MAMTAGAAGPVGGAAAAEQNDENENEPETGIVAVSVVKAHGRHLTLCDILCAGTGEMGLTLWKNLIGQE